jgi:hypothetical protein
MKIEAVGRVIETKDEKYLPGTPFEADDKEAAWLIKNGYAKKADGKGEAKTETVEEKAAKKRDALEAKALELKIGTPEEIKALSDKDLKSGVGKALGADAKEFFSKLEG